MSADLSIRLGFDGLETWDGGTFSPYVPWNRENLSGDFEDMFLAGERLYVSWGISTPIEANAPASDGIEPFHPSLGQPSGFCLT